jgi:hypothetical protein
MGKERRVFIFLLIAIIYALFSSSTPDEMGVAEASIGLLLVLFVGLGVSLDVFGWGFLLRKDKSVIPDYVYVSFIALAVIPTIHGLFVVGNSLGDFMRDFIPFLYLYIPIFFLPHMAKNPSFWLRVMLVALCAIGISYSVRFFLVSTVPISLIGKIYIPVSMSYFPTDPAVLFSTTLLITVGVYMVLQGKPFEALKGIVLLLLGVVAYSSLVAVVVRAQIILVLFSAFVMVLYFMVKKPVRGIPMFVVIALAVYYFLGDIVYDFFEGVFELVMEKFRIVGMNARNIEFIAVIDNAASSTSKTLLGEGWGGLLSNPIYGGSHIRFVHNYFAYFMLKAGLTGLIFSAMYAYWFLKHFTVIARAIRREPLYVILIISILNIFIVHVILEPGFKMFSFGLILLVLTLASLEIREQGA